MIFKISYYILERMKIPSDSIFLVLFGGGVPKEKKSLISKYLNLGEIKIRIPSVSKKPQMN